jgi:uncharacterized membrane protein required for colicin V production
LTFVDAVVLGLVVVLAVRGGVRGLVWQAIRTGAVVTGFLAAGAYASPLGEVLDRHAGVPGGTAEVAGWALLWLACYFLGTWIAHVARKAVHARNLAPVDRTLGAALGGLLGLGIAAFGLVLWASAKEPEDIHASLDGSASVVWMARFVDAVKPAFSPAVRERWEPVLRSLEPGRSVPRRG